MPERKRRTSSIRASMEESGGKEREMEQGEKRNSLALMLVLRCWQQQRGYSVGMVVGERGEMAR